MKQLTKIPIRLDFSFLLMLLGIPFFSLLESGSFSAIKTFLIICTLFFFVILHEYGHAWAALKCNFQVKNITLWYLGGLARIENLQLATAKEEAFIAIAGPLVNIFLAVIALPALLIIGSNYYLMYFIITNLLLAIFNLVPAFPMDGGRLFRSILYWYFDDRNIATNITAKTGIGLGVFLSLGSFLLGYFMIGIIFLLVVYVCYSILAKKDFII